MYTQNSCCIVVTSDSGWAGDPDHRAMAVKGDFQDQATILDPRRKSDPLIRARDDHFTSGYGFVEDQIFQFGQL